jgi:hypothetical protein
VPIILRRAQFLFSPRGWQIYTYVAVRTGAAGLAWMTLGEIAHDLDFKSASKLRAYVDDLVSVGWLKHRQSRGKEYFFVPDPHAVLRSLHLAGKLPAERVEDLDELLDLLDRPTLVIPAAEEVVDPFKESFGEMFGEPSSKGES